MNKVKAPKSARAIALDILTKVETDRAFSNLLLQKTLEKESLPRADIGLVTELVYGTIQRRNTIDYYIGQFVAKGVASLQPWVRNLLRLSFYQLYYLDRIPDHAVVNEAVTLAKKRGHAGISGMVNGVLRNLIRRRSELQLPEGLNPVQTIALKHSHPDWLVARWVKQYGAEAAEAMCEANNAPPHVSVRVNSLKTDRTTLLQQMQDQGVQAEPSAISPDGVVLREAGNAAATVWFREGLLSIQDESSMLVARAVDPAPGMTVLDCCAAPGGKTAHMAERMQDQGTVWANDLHEHKVKLVSEQAARLQLNCVRVMAGDALALRGKFAEESFDRILLDAPCSGLGVIRRKPDLKWVKSAEEIAELPDLQLKLLEAAAPLLKPGGIIVYSTCTIERTENEGVIEKFLLDHPEFVLDDRLEELMPTEARQALDAVRQPGMLLIMPHHYGTDGFYIARLMKRAKPMIK